MANEETNKKLDMLIGLMMQQQGVKAPAPPEGSVDLPHTVPAPRPNAPFNVPGMLPPDEVEWLYQTLKARLVKEAPAIIQTLSQSPEIHVTTERVVIQADKTIKGRVALLISEGFVDDGRPSLEIGREFNRRGWNFANVTLGLALKELAEAGALTKEGNAWKKAPDVKVVKDKG